MAKFPKTLYVRFRDGGSGPDYLDPHETVTSLAEMGERAKVGVYKLVGTQYVEGVAEISDKRGKEK